MQLVDAKSYVIKVPPPYQGGFNWFFVRLQTDTGLVGWGETAVLGCFGGLEKAYVEIVKGVFERYLRGKNPLDRDPLSRTIYGGITSQHADYVMGGVLSAFDLAMWDIAGRHYGAPVADLLGGRHRERIRTYTYMYDHDAGGDLLASMVAWTSDPKRLAVMARRLVDEGFTGLKLDPLNFVPPGWGPPQPWEIPAAEYDRAERCVAAIRKSIGHEADICIGTHGQMTPSCAIRLARRLEAYDPLWLEEPCPPENADEMARIARSTTIPIATGERLAFIHDFQRLFALGACHYAQPDLGSCGGVTAAKQIATLAEAHYVLMAPHVWGGPIITAAAVQLDAAIPNFLIQESVYKSGGFFDEILNERLVWDAGDLVIDDRPGLAIDLNEEALKRHAVAMG